MMEKTYVSGMKGNPTTKSRAGMNCRETARRHPWVNPVVVFQCETPYPTLDQNLYQRRSYRSIGWFALPKGCSQTTNHTNVVHHDKSSPSLRWGNFTGQISALSSVSTLFKCWTFGTTGQKWKWWHSQIQIGFVQRPSSPVQTFHETPPAPLLLYRWRLYPWEQHIFYRACRSPFQRQAHSSSRCQGSRWPWSVLSVQLLAYGELWWSRGWRRWVRWFQCYTCDICKFIS